MSSICGVWWCSNTTYVTSAFLKVKRSSSWKILCLKRGRCLRPRPFPRNRTKRILRCKLTSVVRVFVTSESIDPNNNDLELNVVAYAFLNDISAWNLLKCDEQTLTVLSAIKNASPSLIFPSEENWETKKSTFSTVDLSLTSLSFMLLVPWWRPCGPPYLHSVYSWLASQFGEKYV